ncbi:MAG: hypothetical protein GX465_18640 [Acidobacteria bacterium]|nr:hypothetical protein [Acidobacteriota bacterium]
MNEVLRAQILDEIEQFASRPTLAADEITVSDLAKRLSCGYCMASTRLQKLVEQGVMTVRPGVYDQRTGKIVNAYRKADVSHSEHGEAVE